MNPNVADVFASYPLGMRKRLERLRILIYETAAATDGVGELTETLKWGQPAYLTSASKSGTTIRLGFTESDPARYRMYVHCQTDLIPTFRTLFSDQLEFEGTRAIVFDVSEPLAVEPVALCIEAALTYHLDKRSTRTK